MRSQVYAEFLRLQEAATRDGALDERHLTLHDPSPGRDPAGRGPRFRRAASPPAVRRRPYDPTMTPEDVDARYRMSRHSPAPPADELEDTDPFALVAPAPLTPPPLPAARPKRTRKPRVFQPAEFLDFQPADRALDDEPAANQHELPAPPPWSPAPHLLSHTSPRWVRTTCRHWTQSRHTGTRTRTVAPGTSSQPQPHRPATLTPPPSWEVVTT